MTILLLVRFMYNIILLCSILSAASSRDLRRVCAISTYRYRYKIGTRNILWYLIHMPTLYNDADCERVVKT